MAIYEHLARPAHFRGTFSVLFESAPDAMIVTDRNGRILEVNREAERQFGYSREELTGASVEKLVPERLRDIHHRYRDAYQRAPNHRPMNSGQEIIALRKNGS